MNNVTLIGNLGADPELRHTQTGTPVANFRVATNERFNDSQGNRQERTEWHRITVWGKLATVCAEYLSKGRSVAVTGSLHTRSYKDKDGVTRYVTEIKARNVEFLGSGRGASSKQGVDASEVPSAELDPELTDEQVLVGDDDAPF